MSVPLPFRLRGSNSALRFGEQSQHPLTLLDCERFSSRSEQPFSLLVHSNALVSMDVHAHQADTEVIGYLAGQWDAAACCLRVLGARACKSLDTQDNSVNVEMDPSDSVKVVAEVIREGLSVVGWYHSHPHFCNSPSLVDVGNQHNYQKHFGASDGKFIAAIISPYDKVRGDRVSDTKWFYTREPLLGDNHAMPVELFMDRIEDTEVIARSC